MTENAAKKELWSYMNSKKLEERKLEQIEEQKIKLTKVTSVLSDMPKGTPDNHKLDTNIVQLMELISEHIKIMEDEEKNLIKITNKINMVDQPYKNILELRFIEGKKVYEVSVAIDRSYRYTKTLIKKSIKKYAEI